MERTDGYYFPRSGSSGGSTLTQPQPGVYHQNEPPPAAAQHVYYGAPPPADMQQCYPLPQAPPFMPYPNDPWGWNQQSQAYLAQMQQQLQLQHSPAPPPFSCLIPPPPQPPPPSLLLGQQARLQPPPPLPNLDAILGALDVRYDSDDDDVKVVPASTSTAATSGGRKKVKATSSTTGTTAAANDAASASAVSPSKSAPSAAASSCPAPAAAAAAASIPTITRSSSSSRSATSVSSTSSIPSLLDGLRAEVAARSRPAPDLRSIEHAASILSSRTGKSPKRSSRREESSSRSRRTEERSDSRKENRAADSTRDKRRENRRGGDERRRREEGQRAARNSKSSRSNASPSRRSHRSAERSEQRSDHRERRRRSNGDKREERKERGRERTDRDKEKQSSKDTVESTAPLKPSDIQLKLRESAKDNDKGEVQVFLNSEDERDGEEVEGRDEYEEDEDEEESEVGEGGEEGGGGGESDMDIETEGGESDNDSSSLQQQQSTSSQQPYASRSHSMTDFWASGCAPEDEAEHRLTPETFFASGPSRRVNSSLYREKHRRARALASQALSEDYRERYDLISKHLRSRCVFRGLQSSCGPDAPKLTINDPRPKSKHVQTFPCKESNVQYTGPDAFMSEGASRPSIYKKGGGGCYSGAPQGQFTFVSRSKLVRAPVAPPSAPVAVAAPAKLSLKRTIQNAASSTSTAVQMMSSTSASPSVSSTASSLSTTTAFAAPVTAAAPAAAPSDGPPPAKLSRVDELMAELLTASAAAPMSRTASEPRLDTTTASASSDDARPLAVSSPRLGADRGSSASLASIRSPRPDHHASPGAPKAVVPPRSALSFRKIGDHVVRPGSKLCYEWAESGACSAGVFCHYEHGEGAEAVEKKVCSRMLRGLCRGESHCPLPHGLLPHQKPICAHYLRCDCNHGPDECGLVHIKHNEKVPVCVFFNQGKCTKEDDCTFRHQYRPDVVRALGVHAPTGHPPPTRGLEQRGQRSSRLPPRGRALLTAAAAGRSTTSSAASSPARSAAAAAAEAPAAEDTSTFDWIM